MGPDARCAVGVHCEKWWLSGGPHPQRRLYLLVGDPAPFGLSCGGDAAAGWEKQAGVEVSGRRTVNTQSELVPRWCWMR